MYRHVDVSFSSLVLLDSLPAVEHPLIPHYMAIDYIREHSLKALVLCPEVSYLKFLLILFGPFLQH